MKNVNKCFTKHLFKKGDLVQSVADSRENWYIEDPFTKGLVKGIEIDLEPDESYTFIVVLKSPVQNHPKLFVTNVVLTS